jgi:hypothetical protein
MPSTKQFTLKYLFTITPWFGALHSYHYRLCHAYTPTQSTTHLHKHAHTCTWGCAHAYKHAHHSIVLTWGETFKKNSLIISGQVAFPHNLMKYMYTLRYNLQYFFFFFYFSSVFYVYIKMNKPCIYFCTYSCALHKVTLPSTKSNSMCDSKLGIAGQEESAWYVLWHIYY